MWAASSLNPWIQSWAHSALLSSWLRPPCHSCWAKWFTCSCIFMCCLFCCLEEASGVALFLLEGLVKSHWEDVYFSLRTLLEFFVLFGRAADCWWGTICLLLWIVLHFSLLTIHGSYRLLTTGKKNSYKSIVQNLYYCIMSLVCDTGSFLSPYVDPK